MAKWEFALLRRRSKIFYRLVEKLRKALGLDKKKKDVDEATKFKAGGEVIFTADNMAPDKEAELRKAKVAFTKTKVA